VNILFERGDKLVEAIQTAAFDLGDPILRRIPPQLPTYVSGDSPPQTEVFSTCPYCDNR